MKRLTFSVAMSLVLLACGSGDQSEKAEDKNVASSTQPSSSQTEETIDAKTVSSITEAIFPKLTEIGRDKGGVYDKKCVENVVGSYSEEKLALVGDNDSSAMAEFLDDIAQCFSSTATTTSFAETDFNIGSSPTLDDEYLKTVKDGLPSSYFSSVSDDSILAVAQTVCNAVRSTNGIDVVVKTINDRYARGENHRDDFQFYLLTSTAAVHFYCPAYEEALLAAIKTAGL